jgi:hypothetical protein
MLQAELIHKLDMIAFEGWEYHKLPSEDLEDYWSNPVRETPEPLAATFPVSSNQPEMSPVPLKRSSPSQSR